MASYLLEQLYKFYSFLMSAATSASAVCFASIKYFPSPILSGKRRTETMGWDNNLLNLLKAKHNGKRNMQQ